MTFFGGCITFVVESLCDFFGGCLTFFLVERLRVVLWRGCVWLLWNSCVLFIGCMIFCVESLRDFSLTHSFPHFFLEVASFFLCGEVV